MISNQDKLACAMRELRLRRQVYERRVGNGTMSESQAAREIELMTAIVDDYHAEGGLGLRKQTREAARQPRRSVSAWDDDVAGDGLSVAPSTRLLASHARTIPPKPGFVDAPETGRGSAAVHQPSPTRRTPGLLHSPQW